MKFLIFDGYPELEYGVSEKSDGAMKFDSLKRESYLPAPYVLAHVVHGTRVVVAHADNRGGVLLETDGLVTQEKNLLAGIGPGIRECHFEVQEDIARLFGTKERFVNLGSIIQKQLIELGIKKSNIEDSGECTYCLDQKYFSYRRDKPAQVEAMIAYIGRKHD